jgi:serine/threonine-protein kinase
MNSSPAVSVLVLTAEAKSSVALRIIAGPHHGEEFVFRARDTLVVGRAADAQWQMSKDAHFSRYHFRIDANPPACRLEDLQSSNGTKINGVRAQAADLIHGDRIQCGDTIFEVVIMNSADQAQVITTDFRRDDSWPPATRQSAAVSQAAAIQSLGKIADFDLTRELGRGGMGVVYHAIQKGTGREVAVKVICSSTPIGTAAMQLFLREASILGQLRHPRIVDSIGAGLSQDQLYLAMEYVPVMNWRQMVANQPRAMQIRLVCGIVCRALEALQFAHQRDVVHRDIKPSNILVYKQDGAIQVKLADFGLAKNFMTAGFTSITHEDQIRGTVGFMPPEQIINCRYAKPACDIYAAGACLYYLLSGKMPYESTDTRSTLAMVLNSPPPPLADRISDLPPELLELVARAMKREPAERFTSAEFMRQALLPFAAG